MYPSVMRAPMGLLVNLMILQRGICLPVPSPAASSNIIKGLLSTDNSVGVVEADGQISYAAGDPIAVVDKAVNNVLAPPLTSADPPAGFPDDHLPPILNSKRDIPISFRVSADSSPAAEVSVRDEGVGEYEGAGDEGVGEYEGKGDEDSGDSPQDNNNEGLVISDVVSATDSLETIGGFPLAAFVQASVQKRDPVNINTGLDDILGGLREAEEDLGHNEEDLGHTEENLAETASSGAQEDSDDEPDSDDEDAAPGPARERDVIDYDIPLVITVNANGKRQTEELPEDSDKEEEEDRLLNISLAIKALNEENNSTS